MGNVVDIAVSRRKNFIVGFAMNFDPNVISPHKIAAKHLLGPLTGGQNSFNEVTSSESHNSLLEKCVNLVISKNSPYTLIF